MRPSDKNLKIIWFEGEMLPSWAQLLGVAARLCSITEGTRSWFSRFTSGSGVDDAQIVLAEAKSLQSALQENRESIISQLKRTRDDQQASQIFAAWLYALETMVQGAVAKKTCSWKVEGREDSGEGDYGDGDITLRRV